MEQRERLGLPAAAERPDHRGPELAAPVTSPAPAAASADRDPARRADLVVELGVEELPADDLTSALASFASARPSVLPAAGLELRQRRRSRARRDGWCSRATSVGVREAVREETVKGPPATAAFDKEGKPTRAAEGFARTNGVAVDQLTTEESGGRATWWPRKRVESRPALELLGESIEKPVWRRSASAARCTGRRPRSTFSRPIRWLLALWGDEVVPARSPAWQAASRPGRRAAPKPGSCERAVGRRLSRRRVERARRRCSRPTSGSGGSWSRVERLAESAGGRLDEDADLLEEVANLVEWPMPLLGSFDPAALDAPAEALVTVMKKHQRYFPIYGR